MRINLPKTLVGVGALAVLIVGSFSFINQSTFFNPGNPVKTAHASCNPQSPTGTLTDPTVSVSQPTGTYTKPADIPINISGSLSYYCAGYSYGQEETATSVRYYAYDSTGTQVFSGSWASKPCSSPLCATSEYSINTSMSSSALAPGNYTFKAQAFNATTGATGPGPADESTTSFTIIGAAWNLSCSPAVAPDIYPGGSASFVLETIPTTVVQYSYQISPVVGNGPQINFVPDNSVTRATFSTTASTPTESYTIKFTATDGNGTAKDCFSKITVQQPLEPVTADIKCIASGTTSSSSCNLPDGGYVELTWTSSNADACRVEPGGYTDLNRTTNLPRVTPSSSQYYTLTCYNSSSSVSDKVSVIVAGTPPSSTMSGDLDCNTNIPTGLEQDCTISDTSGFSSTLLAWSTNNVPSGTGCRITRNDLATLFSVTPEQVGNGSTGPIQGINTYKLICGTVTLDTVKVTVVKSPNPPVPVTAQANNNCGVVELNWTQSTGATGYRIYQSTYTAGNSLARDWIPVKLIDATTNPYYSFTPDTQNGNTFVFAVTAINADGESSKAESNMITVNPCGVGSLDLSDNDIVQVTRASKVVSNPTEPCNNSSDVSDALVNFGLFQDGDLIDMQINVCNTGTQPITGLTVDNQMTNLELVTTTPVKFATLGRVAAVSSDQEMTTVGDTTSNANTPPPVPAECGKVVSASPLKIEINSLPAKPADKMASVCSIAFRAKVKYFPPANNPSQKAVAGSLYRFQDLAIIANTSFNKTVVTRPFLFQVVGGAPIRVEGAP